MIIAFVFNIMQYASFLSLFQYFCNVKFLDNVKVFAYSLHKSYVLCVCMWETECEAGKIDLSDRQKHNVK